MFRNHILPITLEFQSLHLDSRSLARVQNHQAAAVELLCYKLTHTTARHNMTYKTQAFAHNICVSRVNHVAPSLPITLATERPGGMLGMLQCFIPHEQNARCHTDDH